MNMTKLTKAQLIEKINALEAEVDALLYEQRPSRGTMVQQLTAAVPRYRDRDGNVFEKHTTYSGQRQTTRYVRVAA